MKYYILQLNGKCDSYLTFPLIYLLQPSYEMPTEVNVYESILKKLWGKMTETDWHTVVKALYILHRQVTSYPNSSPDDRDAVISQMH